MGKLLSSGPIGVAVPMTHSCVGNGSDWSEVFSSRTVAFIKPSAPMRNSFTMRRPLGKTFSARTLSPILIKLKLPSPIRLDSPRIAITGTGARAFSVATPAAAAFPFQRAEMVSG